MYTFSDLIKKIRNEAGLTQEELGQVLGVSTVLIAMIETGQKPASKNFIERLADKLEVHPTSITPFIFIDDNFSSKQMSTVEKSLIGVGESMQRYLVNSRAKRLKQYV